MNYPVLLLLCFVLGCSQSTVHLNTRYLSTEQAAEIVKLLESEDIQVQLNQHPFPQRVTTNTLIYSPLLRDPQVVERLQVVLTESGWMLDDVQALVASNQWFTKDNLGLFLIPDHVSIEDGRSAADLVHDYRSVQCPQEFELQLSHNGRFTLSGKTASSLDSEGQWQLTSYPYLHLSRDDPYLNFYYQVEQLQTQDALGPVHLISLKPLTTSLSMPNCTFEIGRRTGSS